ncbi:uncharacterized protein PHALS_06420 [Plasmopara halstedii]|uniref:Transmembrane protein, putative n=1 Tax=Plasmopara halstedii TaxID=4781 RepID=A0A0P1B1N8_PLAHL|nr:uncharacterized protein PHALS_06420 [Plasmopara halstedii]CEG48607.1 transmembrane protein, putative [Plasmopara halstedii]|eukprot:XP_024584976.1 transmembrane protein, putative [Plasmopara halstedii]
MLPSSRFVAGNSFYNYDIYGGLRSGGLVRFFSSEFVGLVAATFTSSFVYIGVRYGLLPMISSKLQLSESQTEAMDRLVEVPAAMAFFVGLYADAVPLWGSRRKSYMFLGMTFSLLCLTLIGLGCLFTEVLEEALGGSFSFIMMLLMGGVSFGSMINFSSVHTAVVTLSQRESLERRGVFQAEYLIARVAGQISARLLGYVIQTVVEKLQIALILSALMSLSVITIIVVFAKLDEPLAYQKESLRCKCESYWKLTTQKAVWKILVVIASFAFCLNFAFPMASNALRQWTDSADSTSVLLSHSLNDFVTILAVLLWRWRFRNMLWRKFFAVAPTMVVVPQLFIAAFVIPSLYRHSAIYIILTGLNGISSGVMALAVLVPVTEIIEEGSEGGVVGLALSFNTIFKIFVSTLLTSIERTSYFPSSDEEDTTQRRWTIAVLVAVSCIVNCFAFGAIPMLPIQKLDAQLVRMYGGFTEYASAYIAAAFLTSLAYCVAYNITIFSDAVN